MYCAVRIRDADTIVQDAVAFVFLTSYIYMCIPDSIKNFLLTSSAHLRRSTMRSLAIRTMYLLYLPYPARPSCKLLQAMSERSYEVSLRRLRRCWQGAKIREHQYVSRDSSCLGILLAGNSALRTLRSWTRIVMGRSKCAVPVDREDNLLGECAVRKER